MGSAAPVASVEPEYCPQAVIDWYNLTALKGQGAFNRDLSLKAKKHLSALGWRFWYVNKKDRWELRYTSPNNGKNYISLRRACKSCIEDGGCMPQNVPLVQQNNPSPTTVSSSSSDHAQPNKKKKKQEGKCKDIAGVQPRRFKKREMDDDDDDGYYSEEELDEASISACGKRVRSLDGAQGYSDSSQRNPRGIISQLMDNKVVGLYSSVFCRGTNNEVKKGKLLRCGIACDCCGFVFSLTRFEAHAGCKKHRPSATIFLEDGRSLLDCQREAMKEEGPEIVNDSICSVCHYGGELMLCDCCPSSFHPYCLGLDHVPDGEWFCPPCSCKICNRPRYRDDCANDMDNSFLVCDQCERRYHIGCLKVGGFTSFGNHLNDKNWFCNTGCEKVFLGLQKLIGKPFCVSEDNLTWTLMKAVKSDELEGLSQNESKLSVALGVLRECFDPVLDAFFGRDIVTDVIFSRGSELNRLNFRGFYTVVLEKNGEVISVATIRIFGQKVAEIPFVGTRRQYRRLGMCRILMNEIEKQLSYLGVERVVLPSSHYVIDTWRNSFGFERMTNSDKSLFLDYTFLDFQDTIMCHKPLVAPLMNYYMA
ncbi:hypothetical protein VNO77_11147 [Canavalia gladiata]|uniref:Uncharacterized protein n=1 Tax=Canavalia gladiata TaxID=3824 RepID=A0AAN9MB65_CANGL